MAAPYTESLRLRLAEQSPTIGRVRLTSSWWVPDHGRVSLDMVAAGVLPAVACPSLGSLGRAERRFRLASAVSVKLMATVLAADVYLRNLRGSRSNPPGRASADPERRSIYTSALQQFEELLQASRASGSASRPLPLFYALSQGVRALVAARGEQPVVRGHGLGQHNAAAAVDSQVLRLALRKHDNGAFNALLDVMRAPAVPGPVQVGAAWAALPGAGALPKSSWEPDWRPALELSVLSGPHASEIRIGLYGWAANPLLADENVLADMSRTYPSLPHGVNDALEASSPELGPGHWRAHLAWDRTDGELDEVVPLAHGDQRYLQPRIPGADGPLPPIVLWWIVLQGLSLVARYMPEVWAAALQVDDSDQAVPLEWILETALDRLPGLLYNAIYDMVPGDV